MKKREYSVSCVNGRFQPPHLDHLEYMLGALQLSDHIIVGITQPNSIALDECSVDPHRALRSENPLTYQERCQCIELMLLEQGIEGARFSFTPFPIDRPNELPDKVSREVLIITTIRDKWNLEKILVLESLGYSVKVLWDKRENPGVSGTDIRRRIRAGNGTWRELVPFAVSKLMCSEGWDRRIAEMN